VKALGNVMPRHLLDRRLNPSGDLRMAAGASTRESEEVTPLLQIAGITS
jgi:hypothetical protein